MSTVSISRHLGKATEDYPHFDGHILPISEIDTMIISQLIAIFEKNEEIINDRFLDILKGYKKNADEATLDNLSSFLEKDEQLLVEDNPPIDYITIKQTTFRVNFIFSIRAIERWIADEYQFCILINEEPLPAKDQFYMNTYINFESEKQRNEELISLKDRLLEYTNVRFL